MAHQPLTYRFGEYTLEPGEHRLLRENDEVALRPKAFNTLLFLVSRHGHTVTKDELLDAVWPGTFVSDAVLTHCIAEVRQALQDDAQNPRLLRTMPKVGYAFVAEVRRCNGPADAGPFLREVPERRPASAIAVLPFVNLSADPENDYFCDGLSEELINGLTKVPELRVVAHSSSFAFKGRDTDVREIGRQLGVGSVLEGSVRKAGNRLPHLGPAHRRRRRLPRAGASSTTGRSQTSLPCRTRFSQAVLAALRAELAKAGRPHVITPSTASMEAYLLDLQGRSFWAPALLGPASEGDGVFRAGDSERTPRFALAVPWSGGFVRFAGSLGVRAGP